MGHFGASLIDKNVERNVGDRNLVHREGDENSQKNWAGGSSDDILTKNSFCLCSENLSENEFKWISLAVEMPR